MTPMPAGALPGAVGDCGHPVLPDRRDERSVGGALPAAADLDADLAMDAPVYCAAPKRLVRRPHRTGLKRSLALLGRERDRAGGGNFLRGYWGGKKGEGPEGEQEARHDHSYAVRPCRPPEQKLQMR